MPFKSKNILVTGGAGYIASHMVLALQRGGYHPVVLDNFSRGHKRLLHANVPYIDADIADVSMVKHALKEHDIAAVMHFAGLIQVNESVRMPSLYYQQNVAGTLQLLEAMLAANVQHFIFSSSAAVYGEPQYTPIDEHHRIAPINPYGASKAMVERILEDYAKQFDFSYTALRYFNAAGRDPKSHLAECHEPETHLIPLVLQVAAGLKEAITVYGTHYPTIDGSCVRDYVHVNDICQAHLLALEALIEGAPSGAYNIGTGQGYTVKEVITAAKQITGKDISVIWGDARLGDPAVLVANAEKLRKNLGWNPIQSDLKTIISHAWEASDKTPLKIVLDPEKRT